MTGFNQPALKQLTDQQVRFAPPARRAEQLVRAERLLAEVDPTKRYPYQFVCWRITDYRPDTYPNLLIPGEDLKHDLRLMIQTMRQMDQTFAERKAEHIEAKALPLEVEKAPEPILTLDEISKKLNVSTKTIRRWRKYGLVAQPIVTNGKRQVGFLQSVVDRFLTTHPDRVERGSRFSQMTESEREDILRRARRLSRVSGGTLTEVSRRIARRLGRSVETVRYTIKNHDRQYPEQALFPNLTGPLDAATKQTIYSSYRRGINVDTLAKRFQRTRTSMYRVINEVRAQRLLEQPLDYIPHPSFDDPAMEAVMLAPMPDAEAYEAKRRAMHAPKDVPPELASCYEYPLLSKEQEQHLFRKMNFLKHKAAQLRDQLRKEGGEANEVDPSRVRNQTLKEIEDLQKEANVVKELLINANMRLVVSIAKKHAGQADNFFELVSDGNMSLIRAVEKFDFGRGFKFSTYASWAIMKNFARSIPDEIHRRERFVTGHEDLFEIAPDTRSDEHEMLATQERASHSVNRLLEYLEPREREIIRMRAGLDDHARGMTLEEIGQQFGITKERVRQLNARAMKKLRSIAEGQDMDLL
ncbi:MAG TPA: sigma-70 family RNA polymerase sigma factor [Gemmataceae bacterium]|nr:sigma-70 family RNA polymerase sigma factor [Gemmataceae bacterium]